MARPLWKGNIGFGLVSIPVQLYSATRRNELRFRQIDRRDTSPIRERRVSEQSGQEVPWDDVVKGYEMDDGNFVILEHEDFEKANVKATETIDIIHVVQRDEIPAPYYDTPHFIVPTKAGLRPYHILRETLRRTDRVAVASIVMRGRQHMAALMPDGDVMLLELLRFAHELKSIADLDLKDDISSPELRPEELSMAEQLVGALDTTWAPEQYRDEYREDLLALIEEKAKSGGRAIPHGTRDRREQPGEVVDMMELLKRSVGEAKRARKDGRTAKKAS